MDGQVDVWLDRKTDINVAKNNPLQCEIYILVSSTSIICFLYGEYLMEHKKKTYLMYLVNFCTLATVNLYLPIKHPAQMRQVCKIPKKTF